MQRNTIRFSLGVLVSGLGLLACGGPAEVDLAHSEEPLGTELAALCYDGSVSVLGLNGISTYDKLMAGNGPWATSGGANSVHLKFYLDGVYLQGKDAKLCNADSSGNCTGSGTWTFGHSNVACGSHHFQIEAIPLVTYSNGDTYGCGTSRWLSHTVPNDPTCLPPPAPTASLSCFREYSSSFVDCTSSASGGSGSYTPLWYQYRSDTGGGGWFEGGWSNFFGNCADPYLSGGGTYYEWLEIGFKVRDSNGVESAARYAYFDCASGWGGPGPIYPEPIQAY